LLILGLRISLIKFQVSVLRYLQIQYWAPSLNGVELWIYSLDYQHASNKNINDYQDKNLQSLRAHTVTP